MTNGTSSELLCERKTINGLLFLSLRKNKCNTLPVVLMVLKTDSDTLPLVMLSVLSPLATKSYSATNRLGSFSLGPANRFSLEFQRAASDSPGDSKSGR